MRRQSGIGLPAAIFVITVMAALAVAVLRLVQQNAETFEEEVRLTRAFYAAESGIGFGMSTLYPPEEYPDYTASCSAFPLDYELTVDGLNGCSVQVNCSADATVDEVDYFTLVSEGSCGDVSRTLQVRSGY
ncbi:MAG: hypothetical protein WEB57_14910 [Pseudohongiellaceae bacterium]